MVFLTDQEETMSAMKPWEGRSVVGCSVKITRAGDGLSDALTVDPVELQVNERVFYVLEGEVSKVSFDRLNAASSDVQRVHTVSTVRITAVDGPEVAAYLDDAESHVRRAMAEINDDQLVLDDVDPDDLEADGSTITDEVEKARKSRKSKAAAPEAEPAPTEGDPT